MPTASLPRVLLVAALLVLPGSTVWAQQHPNTERGFAADKVYQFGGIDQVNVLNGNVILRIPLGDAYPVSANFSYGLVLHYSAKLWDFEEMVRPTGTFGQALPNRRSNAGLGWLVSLGRLIPPSDPTNNTALAWIYESADGGDHVFFPTLHEGETSEAVSYTRDGTYLRMQDFVLPGGIVEREVHFPDGIIHRFGNDNRLKQMRDRFGNFVDVTYPNATTWKLRDMHAREHFVYFVSMLSDGVSIKVVDKVVVTAFGETPTTTTFDFTHTSTGVRRGCVFKEDTTLSPTPTVPLLTQVDLPDGSRFVFDYFTDNADLSCRQGAVRSMQLPTLGRIEYSYQQYHVGIDGCNSTPYPYGTAGVKTRRLLDAAGADIGAWEYATELNPRTAPRLCDDGFTKNSYQELKNTITSPLKDKTVHYFSVWPHPQLSSADGFQAAEYGLPFTRLTADSTGSRFLSTQVLDCDSAGLNCVQKRSGYARYDKDPATCVNVDSGCFDANRREASSRVVHNDDGNRFADVTFSDFDGLGHYRTTTLGGNFNTGNSQTIFRDFNSGRGTYPGSFMMLQPFEPWVLGTYGRTKVTEGGQTFHTHSCFDGATGFRQAVRALEATDATGNLGAHDLLLVATPSQQPTQLGNVEREEYFGGDAKSLPTSSPCTPGTSTRDFGLRHTYAWGALATSRYLTAAGGDMPFLVADRTIDQSTGLASRSRDTATLESQLEYDTLGRLRFVKPQSTGFADGWTEYQYFPATGSTEATVARVEVLHRGVGGAGVLAKDVYRFDAFGRSWLEEKLMPNGTLSQRETLYNALGLPASVSALGARGQKTQYQNYDAFGRATRIVLPDASDITLDYFGVRKIDRTLAVGTIWNGIDVVTENATTAEFYDRQGRLWRVQEPSGPSDAIITTTYSYDAQGRLTQATTSGSGATQVRSFNYDGRGLLKSENHPEKDTGPGQTADVAYKGYDARGNLLRWVDGTRDLAMSYDEAGRVTQVRQVQPPNPDLLLKQFQYWADNDLVNSDFRLSKLRSATRHNRFSLCGISRNAQIEETYTYRGRMGRVSQRDLRLIFDGVSGEAFAQTFTWTALGQPASIGYPQCTFCTAASPRTVSFTYTNGWLSQVPGFANNITYHANGLWATVAHANNVNSVQDNDLNFMQRPRRLYAVPAAGGTRLWDSGDYRYDEAGNVLRTGSGYFLYDKVSRVKDGHISTVPLGGGTLAFQTTTYDAFGNVQSLLGTSGRTTPTDSQTNRLCSGACPGTCGAGCGGTASYSAAGELLGWNFQTYDYDQFHMLQRSRLGAEDWLHFYTADDERVWSYRVGGSTYNRWTLRGLDGEVLREYASDSAGWRVVSDYVYRDGQLLAAATPTDTKHFHFDHLGTPRAITNSAGTRAAFHAYYPFGEEATSSTQDAERLRFTGHETDFNSQVGSAQADDLTYMHARHCSPITGRFLSIDPVMGDPHRPQAWNRYAYALNNPLKWIDPTGEVIGLAHLTEEQRQELIEKLNAFTGNTYAINESVELVLKEVGASSSKTATNFLNDLIGSDTVYTVEATSGKSKGLFDSKTAYINFGSFTGADYGRVDPRTFNLGSTLIHELFHASTGTQDLVDGVFRLSFDWTGPAVDLENRMRAERGLPLRAAYNAEPTLFGHREKVLFKNVNPKKPEKIYYVIRPWL